jgi:hypothetical protein
MSDGVDYVVVSIVCEDSVRKGALQLGFIILTGRSSFLRCGLLFDDVPGVAESSGLRSEEETKIVGPGAHFAVSRPSRHPPLQSASIYCAPSSLCHYSGSKPSTKN